MPDEMKEDGAFLAPEIRSSEKSEPVGRILARARIDHGWDVDDVDRMTHISPGWVVVVEQGNWTQYPSMVYAKGHVKAYADALGLDVATILESFQKEWDGSVIPDNVENTMRNHSGISIHGSGPSQKTVLVSLVVVGLLIAVFVAVRYALTPRTVGHKDMIMVNPPPSTPLKNSLPPALSGSVGAPEPAKPPALLQTIPPVSPMPPKTALPVPSPTESPLLNPETRSLNSSSDISKAVRPEDSAKPPFIVRMVAIKNTWVAVSVDAGSVHRFHLKSGEGKVLSGTNFMTFSTGRGDGLVLFLNGRRVGMAGQTDSPVLRRRITRQSLKARKSFEKAPARTPLSKIETPSTDPVPGKKSGTDPSLQAPSPAGVMPIVPKNPEYPQHDQGQLGSTTPIPSGRPSL